jgi:glycosyltransferase involved in cell wall biosynthesis
MTSPAALAVADRVPWVTGGKERGGGGPLRVLVVHNRYRQPGGEDAVVRDEIALLSRMGVIVEVYERDNHEIDSMSPLRVAVDTVWSARTAAEIDRLLDRFKPHVVHAHNTFPLVSPSLYASAERHRVAVVQTLHNFRLFCVQAMFMRSGKVCEDCLGALPWRGIAHRCYRDSVTQSAVAVGMLGVHRALGTYRKRVTRYIALNRFCRDKFVEAGLPAERIVIKPNFVDLPPPATDNPRSGALFVGRLAPEKGVSVLLAAARLDTTSQIDVIGGGPDEAQVRGTPGVRALGWRTPEEIYARMRGAACLVMPSLWYENFPRTLVEAYACGLPVVASRLGAMAELVVEGKTGLLFEPGNAADLALTLEWAERHPEEMRRMGAAARKLYESRYTPEANFRQLTAIYEDAILACRGAAHHVAVE